MVKEDVQGEAKGTVFAQPIREDVKEPLSLPVQESL